MINLIPTQEKIRLAKTYQARFFIIFLTLSAIAIFIGTTLLFSPYRQAEEKTTAVKKELEIVKSLSSIKEDGNPEFLMKEIQNKIGVLSSKKSQTTPSLAINNILENLPQGVLISGFSYSKTGSNTENIEVRGVADNRETFLAFVRKLESEGSFTKVNVPVSNFLSDTNLNFSVQISAKQTPK